jgi:foldase protein PrsA
MMRAARLALCVSAVIGGGALMAGCGGVPGNAVATVDGDSIPRTEYTHWLGVFTKQASGQQQQGTAKPTAKQLRDSTLQYLISSRWLDGEAQQQHVAVTDAEVKKSFADQKKQSFPKDADYKNFLKTSGQSEQDVLQRVRYSLISNKISTKVAGKGAAITDKTVSDYYAKNKAQFAQPEKRDLRVVLTKDSAHAKQALSALNGGDSWEAVAKKYSIDAQTKAAGGKLPGQPKGQLDPDLDKAVFSAPKNKLTGPLKTQFGYFVFSVTGVTPPSQQSLDQAKDTIKQTLQQQNQQKALDSFVKDFTQRWRDKTRCSTGFKTSDCKNGPKPTPTPTAAAPQTAPAAPPAATPAGG